MSKNKKIRFNKTSIDALSVPAGRQRFHSDEVPALFVEVSGTGVKTFRVRRKVQGKAVTVTLGKYPDMTPTEAKAEAQNTLSQMAKGVDPNRKAQIHKLARVTLAMALDDYIADRAGHLAPNTVTQYQRLINTYSHTWANLPLADITRDMVAGVHRRITNGMCTWPGDDGNTKSMRKPSPAQADLWGRVFRAIYKFAQDHYRDEHQRQLLPENPANVLNSKRQWNKVPRKTSRIRNHELGRWLDALDTVRRRMEASEDRFRLSVVEAITMATFTGLRRSEVFGLTWDRVNLEGRYFWFDETKNGDKLELPITDTLMALFRRRQLMRNGEQLVFPGDKSGRPIGEPRRTLALISEATVPNPNPDDVQAIKFRCHDARRTYSSIAELAGVGTYIIKRLINHRTGNSADVTQGYINFSADELRGPAEKVEHAILEHAGRIEPQTNIDNKLAAMLAGLSDAEKRKLLFQMSEDLNGTLGKAEI